MRHSERARQNVTRGETWSGKCFFFFFFSDEESKVLISRGQSKTLFHERAAPEDRHSDEDRSRNSGNIANREGGQRVHVQRLGV